MTSVRYYGPDGELLDGVLEWGELFEARSDDDAAESWWRRRTEVNKEVTLSTVWLGLDHRFLGGGRPLIWETMIFGGEYDEYQWRYSTRQEALDDHERILAELRAGAAPKGG